MTDKTATYPGSTLVSTPGRPAAGPDDTRRRNVLHRIRQFSVLLRIGHAEAVRETETLVSTIPPNGDAMRLAARIAASAPPQSIIAFTGLDSNDDAGTVAFQSALALTRLEAKDILLVKPAVFRNFPFQGPDDEDRLKPIEVEDLPRMFQMNRYSRLYVLSAWRFPPPADQSSTSLLQFLRDVRRHFHMTIVECSPLLKCPDASLPVSRSQGTVVVLDESRHTRSELREVQNELQRLNAPFLGAVLAKRKRRQTFFRRR